MEVTHSQIAWIIKASRVSAAKQLFMDEWTKRLLKDESHLEPFSKFSRHISAVNITHSEMLQRNL